jgi:CheY-like chemotaxis protein
MECSRVLIVEGDLELRRTVVEALREREFVVHETADPQQAFAWLLDSRNDVPDAILFDLAPPVVDSRWFLHSITSLPRTCKIPIIATTGAQPILDDALALCAHCLYKPYSVSDLAEALQTAIGKAHA